MALSSGASQAALAAAFSSNETSDWSGIATIPNMAANHLESGSGDHLAVRQGRSLEYFTLGWNTMEAVVAVAAGVFAQSTSLLGFGIDSCIESLSGTVLLWRLRLGEKGERREKRSLKLVGASFLILAAYVVYESAETLFMNEPPDVSYVGIALAAASVVAMPLLARAKRRVAARPGRLHHKSLSEQHLFQVGVIPTGGEAFVLHADRERVIVLQEAQRRATQDAEVGIGVAKTQS